MSVSSIIFRNIFKSRNNIEACHGTIDKVCCNFGFITIRKFSQSPLSLRKLNNTIRDQGLPTEWILKLTSMQDIDFSQEYIMNKLNARRRSGIISAQKDLPLAVQAMGCEIACAQVIVALGGAVRFHGHKMWHSKDKTGKHSLPNAYVEGLALEAIDASGTELRYEGIEHMCLLERVQCVDLSRCSEVDDWCVSRLQALAPSLLYLNLSACPVLTSCGLETLRHLKNLRRLVVRDLPSAGNKELACLMLEEILPDCLIEGVDYSAALEDAQNAALSTHVHTEEEKDEDFDRFLRKLGYAGDTVKREYFTRDYDTGSSEMGLDVDEATWQRLVEEELMEEVERARQQREEEQRGAELYLAGQGLTEQDLADQGRPVQKMPTARDATGKER